jgi:hypothetical protein
MWWAEQKRVMLAQRLLCVAPVSLAGRQLSSLSHLNRVWLALKLAARVCVDRAQPRLVGAFEQWAGFAGFTEFVCYEARRTKRLPPPAATEVPDSRCASLWRSAWLLVGFLSGLMVTLVVSAIWGTAAELKHETVG